MLKNDHLHPAFLRDVYVFRRALFSMFGSAFHVFDSDENLVLYAKQKAFKLREDFRLYSDSEKTQELLVIKTPQVFENYATFHVHDATTGEHVGSIRRKGLQSIIKDEWTFLSPESQKLGKLTESSMTGALLSRFINFVPQQYIIVDNGGKKAAEIDQHMNPFVLKYTFKIVDPGHSFDPRLILAAGILLAGIERRQG